MTLNSRTAKQALIILTAINLLNYVDRWLISAVMPAMSEELHLSNTAAGFIMSAFMTGYFVTSPFFGYLADRIKRVHVIASGTVVWSFATSLASFASGQWHLIFSRVIVGVGEAATVSTSQALLSDFYPPEKRNKVLGIYLCAIPVGAALGFILGGILTTHFGWRHAFLIAGIPGLALAFAVYFLKEPLRGTSDSHGNSSNTNKKNSFKADVLELLRNKNYMSAVWGYAAFTFTIGGLGSWVPQYLVKVRHAPLQQADTAFGAITVVAGVLGSLIGAWVATHFLKKKKRGDMQFIFWVIIIATPLTFLCFVIQNVWGFYAMIAAVEFLLFATQPTVNVVFLETVRPEIRSMALAFSVFMIHLFGDLISPPIVGIVADHWDLRSAIFILPLALIPAAYFYGKTYKLLSRSSD